MTDSAQCPTLQLVDGLFAHLLAGADEQAPVLPPMLMLRESNAARELALPKGEDRYEVPGLVQSARLADGDFACNPYDKKRVSLPGMYADVGDLTKPPGVTLIGAAEAAQWLYKALHPPEDIGCVLPYTANMPQPLHTLVGKVGRLLVHPGLDGHHHRMHSLSLIVTPGGGTYLQDFHEQIFGLEEPFADPRQRLWWNRRTAVYILAPHLKAEHGEHFQLTFTDSLGIVVIMTSGYQGYVKKLGGKRPIIHGIALQGGLMEDHSGGALLFPGSGADDFYARSQKERAGGMPALSEAIELIGADNVNEHSGGYYTLKGDSAVHIVPHNARLEVNPNNGEGTVTWRLPPEYGKVQLQLRPGLTFVYSDGVSVSATKPKGASLWQIKVTEADGVLIVRSDTVSGASKSETSNDLVFRVREGVLELRVGERWFAAHPNFAPMMRDKRLDDITVSLIATAGQVWGSLAQEGDATVIWSTDCEDTHFDRREEGIDPGADPLAEQLIGTPDLPVRPINYEWITPHDARLLLQRDDLGHLHSDMLEHLRRHAQREGEGLEVTTLCPIKVNGKPIRNVRVLLPRRDLVDPAFRGLAKLKLRLARKVPAGNTPVATVNHFFMGRRCTPPDPTKKRPAYCAHSPFGYEGLARFLASAAGCFTPESPSIEAAGSLAGGLEGVRSKGPFDPLPPVWDLNALFFSRVLLGEPGAFTTTAGYVGLIPVGHDVGQIILEAFARIPHELRNHQALLDAGYLERVPDFGDHPSSLLPDRITAKFVADFIGQVMANPHDCFTKAMLQPETQQGEVFAESLRNMVAAMKLAVEPFFASGQIEQACFWVRQVLEAIRDTEYADMGRMLCELDQGMPSRTYLMRNDAYHARLAAQAERDRALWEAVVRDLQTHNGEATDLDAARAMLQKVGAPDYIKRHLMGTLGAEPSLPPNVF